MSLAKTFETLATKASIKQIVDGEIDASDIMEKLPTSKTTYNAGIVDIFTSKINTVSLSDYKKIIKAVSKITDAIMKAGVISLNTKAKLYTDVRKTVKEASRVKLLKGVLSMTTQEANLRKERQQARVKEMNKRQIGIEDKTVENMIRKLMAKDNKSLADKIILAQLSLGTRLIEILNKNVSTFKKDPSNVTEIIQTGVAKSRPKHDEIETEKRSVTKPTIVITPSEFMSLIEQIRAVTDKDSSKTNAQITNKYSARVNTEVKKIFKVNKIPKELKSSHALRKIWANYSWKHNAPKGESLVSWISEKLGHDPDFISDSANYYSTIDIETASVLTEHQASEVSLAKRTAVANRDEINILKDEIKVLVENIPAPSTEPRIEKDMTTKEKFKFIEDLMAQGITSYTKLQKFGVTTYMLSMYKKQHKLKGEIQAPQKKQPSKKPTQTKQVSVELEPDKEINKDEVRRGSRVRVKNKKYD